jgi:hypothetical protein
MFRSWHFWHTGDVFGVDLLNVSSAIPERENNSYEMTWQLKLHIGTYKDQIFYSKLKQGTSIC